MRLESKLVFWLLNAQMDMHESLEVQVSDAIAGLATCDEGPWQEVDYLYQVGII